MAQRWRLAILVGSLLLALAAQWVLSYLPAMWGIGAAGYGAALAVLAVGLLWRKPQGERRPTSRRVSFLWRPTAIVSALLLISGATYLAHIEHSYGYAVLLWLGGVAVAVAALVTPKSKRRHSLARGASRQRGQEAWFVTALFLAALILRLVKLDQIPELMLGDEGSMALEVARILRGNPINPFGTGWFSHPNLFFYLEAAALRLFGWNLFGLRFTAALLGALGAPAIYFLGKWTFGRRTGWVGAALLVGWGLHLNLSRLALNNSADPLFGALALGLLQRGLVKGRRGYFVAAGLTLGLSLYFYHATRLLAPMALVVALLGGVGRLRRRWRGLAAFAIATGLVVAPLAFHFVQNPAQFLSRHQTLDIFRSGELAAEEAATGKPAALLLLERLGQATFAFVYTRDRGYFYTAETPMLDVLCGALFTLGVGLALYHWREARYKALVIWLGLTIVFGGWLLRSPPHYQRYLIAAPAICLLAGRAAVILLRQVARIWRVRQALQSALLLLAAVVLAALNAGEYFGAYVPSGRFSDRNTEIADRTARLMAELGPDYTTYFLGTPRMPLGGFNSVYFLAPDAVWMDVPEATTGEWEFVQAGRGALFVFFPERERELAALRERFPNGEEKQVLGRDGQVLFVTYRVAEVEADEVEGDS